MRFDADIYFFVSMQGVFECLSGFQNTVLLESIGSSQGRPELDNQIWSFQRTEDIVMVHVEKSDQSQDYKYSNVCITHANGHKMLWSPDGSSEYIKHKVKVHLGATICSRCVDNRLEYKRLCNEISLVQQNEVTFRKLEIARYWGQLG